MKALIEKITPDYPTQPHRSRFFLTKTIYIFCILAFFLLSCKTSPPATDRYVVLSPEIAEILASLGVVDRIVGVTAECDFPPELLSKQKVGNFGQVSIEQIVSLRPSIVFSSSLEQSAIASDLSKLNIHTVEMYPHDLSELLSMIEGLGKLCEKESEADSLIEYISTIHSLQISPENKKPQVYIEIYGDPIMSVSDESYVGNLLKYAGGVNIFPTLARDYARVNAEDIVRKNPDVIIVTYPGVTVDDICRRKGWGDISAVKNRRVYTVDDINPDLILRAGPRNVEGVERLAEVIGVMSDSSDK